MPIHILPTQKANASQLKGKGTKAAHAHQNDWMCPHCQKPVFGSKSHCFRCENMKPLELFVRGDLPCETPGCMTLIYGSKKNCYKCGAKKNPYILSKIVTETIIQSSQSPCTVGHKAPDKASRMPIPFKGARGSFTSLLTTAASTPTNASACRQDSFCSEDSADYDFYMMNFDSELYRMLNN